ncbi:MAG: hypothetical protein WCE49_17250 [Terrimicrobiaceae bacterium]
MITAAGSLALVILAGCGGDSRRAESEGGQTVAVTPTTQTTQASSPKRVAIAKVTDPARRAYIARVDRICSNLDPERSSARERVAGSTDVQEASKAYDDTITSGETELRRIQAIPPPPGESQLLRANVFDVINRQLALRGEIRNALPSLDIARLQALQGQLDDLSRSVTAFARGYGFRVCGED